MNLKSLRLWLNIVVIAGLIALIFVSRHQIIEVFRELGHLNLYWLALMIPLQLANFGSAAFFYKSYLAGVGKNVSLVEMLKVALEMNFINHVLPSGGVSGFGYFSMRMKSVGVSGSKSTLTQMMRHALTFLSFIIFLIAALIILSLFGSASRLMVLITSMIIFLTIFGTLIMIYIISSSARIKKFTAFLPKVINRFVGVFRSDKKNLINVDRIEHLFGELHEDYVYIKHNWRILKWPFIWTILMNLTELMTIVVVYYAFGSAVNIGAVIIAYAVANTAGLLAALPGGIAKALALSATLVYRILTMVVFLPVGFVLYHLALKQHKVKEIARGAVNGAES